MGVVARTDGKPGYTIAVDEYIGGKGMVSIAGRGCSALKQSYAIAAATRAARKQGFRVSEQKLANGSVQLVCQKG